MEDGVRAAPRPGGAALLRAGFHLDRASGVPRLGEPRGAQMTTQLPSADFNYRAGRRLQRKSFALRS
jgi:hypothetical protein